MCQGGDSGDDPEIVMVQFICKAFFLCLKEVGVAAKNKSKIVPKIWNPCQKGSLFRIEI